MKEYNLEKRTLSFSKELLKVITIVPKNFQNLNILKQLSRSGTSIGANYREAVETSTNKDLKNRIRICKKEAKETVYWLELLKELNMEFAVEITELYSEAIELNSIFGSIYRKIY